MKASCKVCGACIELESQGSFALGALVVEVPTDAARHNNGASWLAGYWGVAVELAALALLGICGSACRDRLVGALAAARLWGAS